MAPRSVLDTCDWTATSAKFFGRYLRASARDIARREYPRPYGATKDTACRCYLRGPDGVNGLTPSGTWGKGNIVAERSVFNCPVRLRVTGHDFVVVAVKQESPAPSGAFLFAPKADYFLGLLTLTVGTLTVAVSFFTSTLGTVTCAVSVPTSTVGVWMVSVCVPTTGFSTWYSPSPVFLQAEIETTAITAATAANLRTRRLPSKSVLAGKPGDIGILQSSNASRCIF